MLDIFNGEQYISETTLVCWLLGVIDCSVVGLYLMSTFGVLSAEQGHTKGEDSQILKNILDEHVHSQHH